MRSALERNDLQLVPESALEEVSMLMESNTPFRIQDGQLEVAQAPRPNWNVVWDWSAQQWIDPRTNETQWVIVRAERTSLLAASDWTQMPDAPDANKAAWAVYRQALRDITAQADPFNISWPSAPV